MDYGHFNDDRREYVITEALPPKPWINYLGNRRLSAFISQNAGGMLWHVEPQCRRISRYHYTAGPKDRPGFLRLPSRPDIGPALESAFRPHLHRTRCVRVSTPARHDPICRLQRWD